jgi:hypothetical protein
MNLLDGADQTPDERDELLNKWKDKPQEEVLKAKVEADLHIKALEREKAELREMYLSQREELLAKAKFEELIDQMKSPTTNLPVANTPAKEVEKPYDPKDIETLFDQKLSAYERQKTEAENFNRVQSKLMDKYGSNYASVLKDQQNSLGLSVEEINGLAKKSPEAFFRMMGLNDAPKNSTYQAPPRTNQRNDSYAPKVQVRDYNYYQELKKTNPKLYLDPKISLQMERDAQELGDRFGLPD